MITLVYAYYENADMLREQIRVWRYYADHVAIVIVDDGSPTKPALEILQPHTNVLNLKLFRVLKNIPWNQDGARNLAMQNVDTEWAFMTDMDHVVPVPQLHAMTAFSETAPKKHYYMPNQRKVDGTDLQREHPNSYLMRVEDFWFMGGYDEDFAGAYGSDGNFRRCAQQASGLIEVKALKFHTIVYRSEDIMDANTKDFGRKGSEYHVGNIPHLFKKARSPAYKAVNPIRFPWERQL